MLNEYLLRKGDLLPSHWEEEEFALAHARLVGMPVNRTGGKETEVLFSLPSGGALECFDTHRRGEARSQIPNEHSVWERSSNRSKRTSVSFLVALITQIHVPPRTRQDKAILLPGWCQLVFPQEVLRL